MKKTCSKVFVLLMALMVLLSVQMVSFSAHGKGTDDGATPPEATQPTGTTETGAEEPHEHKMEVMKEKSATCTEDGVKVTHLQCVICKKHFAYKDFERTKELKDSQWKINALGHSPAEDYTTDEDATCTDPGSKSKHCTRCGEIISETIETIPATGRHSYIKDAKGNPKPVWARPSDNEATATFTCETCGYKKTVSATVTEVVKKRKPATTKDDGLKVLTATVTFKGKTLTDPTPNKVTIPAVTQIALSKTKCDYTGKEIEPSVTVKDRTGALLDAANYKVTYKNNIKVGNETAMAIVTLQGDYYKGSKTLYFSIVQKTIENFKGTFKNGKIILTWDKVSDAATYKITSGKTVVADKITGTTQSIDSINGNPITCGTYSFKVTAYDKQNKALLSAATTLQVEHDWAKDGLNCNRCGKADSLIAYKSAVFTPDQIVVGEAFNSGMIFVAECKEHNYNIPVSEVAVKNYFQGLNIVPDTKKIGTHTITLPDYADKDGNNLKVSYDVIPKAPTGLKATSKTKSVTLTWDKIASVDGYKVYYKSTLKATCKKNESTITGLKPGLSYKFTVVSFKKVDGKIYESPKTPITVKTKLATPKINKIESKEKGKATIKWTEVEGATQYVVYYSLDKDNNFKKGPSTTKTSATVDNLTRGKMYYFKVYAYNKVGKTGSKVVSTKIK